MYKRKSMRLRRFLAMIMAILIISGQLESVAYAKGNTVQSIVQQETKTDTNGSPSTQYEQGQEDNTEQGSSLENEDTSNVDSTEQQNDLGGDEAGNTTPSTSNANENKPVDKTEQKTVEESQKKSNATDEQTSNTEEEVTHEEDLQIITQAQSQAPKSYSEGYDDLKNAVTNNSTGFSKGLGTANNFGIFVNGLFSVSTEFEANLAVRKLYSVVTPKMRCDDNNPTQAQQALYIQNFADQAGNILTENPLPVDYFMEIPALVLGNGYQINDNVQINPEDGIGYGIDGKMLGYSGKISSILQDPSGSQFIDFDSEFNYLKSLSTHLASFATTKTANVTKNGSSLDLQSTSDQVDIFNLSSVDFLNDTQVNTNINLSSTNNATCIINVDMTDNTNFEWNNQVTINGKNDEFLSEAGKILWNFYTTEINEKGEVVYKPYEGRLVTTATMFGTFLAPSAKVEIGSGDFNGCIMAQDLVSNTSKINKVPFTGTIPESGTQKSETVSGETTLNLNKTATYTGDFDSESNTGNRTYQVDLTASAVPVITEKTEQTPNDIVLVLDRSGSMSEIGASGATRLEELNQAAKSFVNAIKTNSPDSSIDVISYASSDGAQEVSNDTGVFLNVSNSYDSILGAIDGLSAQGATRTDLAMQSAYNCLNEATIRNDGRPKTVVLFSDGVPTMTNTFDDGVASEAKTFATRIKSEFGATVFTIGLLSTLSADEKAKAETFLTDIASNKKDSTEKRFSQTTENLSLEDIFIKVSNEITGEITGATVRDYISEYFVLTEECKAKLDKMENVSYGYNKASNRWYVEWKNQTIPTEGKWSSTLEIEAKNEFIGGNDIATNASASGIFMGETKLANFPQPKVNVPVKFSVGNEETTIRKGQLIPTDLYNSSSNKKEYVQTLMYNQYATPDIFLGNKETGKFTYKWYWGNTLVGEGKSLESLIDGVIIDKETVLTLKVTFEPYNSDTSTDGQKGLAKATPHTGTYTIHLINPVNKNLWINKCATYTGDFNSKDNTGKRTYLVKLVSNTLRVSSPDDVVIVIDRSQQAAANKSLPKYYVHTQATNIQAGNFYYIKESESNSFVYARIKKDSTNKFYYEQWNSTSSSYEKIYVEESQVYNAPSDKDYISNLDQVKQEAINLVEELKKSDPNTRICIISYASNNGVTNDTQGFKNVSNDTDTIINAIKGISSEGTSTPQLGLEEAYNVLNDDSIKSDGRTKTVALFSADVPRTTGGALDYNASQEAVKYANMLKQDLGANLYTVMMKNASTQEDQQLANNLKGIASDVTANSAEKTYFNYMEDDVFSALYNEVSDGIAGATVIDYIDERFQFTEETKKMFESDQNISYGFDQSRNQWYVKYNKQIIPTNESVWFEAFEIEAKDEFIGGNCIPTNGDDSGIYYEDKKLKDFPRPKVNVPIKFEVGNQETTIFYGEKVPQQLYDANTSKNKGVQTLMFDENAVPDMFLGKGVTGTFKYEWYKGDVLIGEGKDLNTLVKDVELSKDQLYTLKVTFMPNNQLNAPDKGKGLATDTSHTGTYLVHVVKGSLTIRKTIDNQYTDIKIINANQSFVFEVKRYAVNDDGSKGDYIESYFETISFAANEDITTKEKTIMNLKKGYYEVVEDTDWSWKYNLVSVKDSDIYSNAPTGTVFVGNKNEQILSTNHYFGEMNVATALAKVEFVNQIKDTNWLGDVSVAINKFINKYR